MAQYQMAIDATKCLNCKACLLACQQRNGVPYTCNRNWVKAHYVGEDFQNAPKDGWHYQPGGCMQCDEPICVKACPTNATYKGIDGVVAVDEDRCVGCSACVKACPYNARFRNPNLKIVEKCDYCEVSRKVGLEPACVLICPTKARTFGDLDDPNSNVSKLIAKHKANNSLVYVESKETPTKPKLVYLNYTSLTDWPEQVEVPFPVSAMEPTARAIKFLGGFTLFGVIAVFLKQFIMPSDDADDSTH